MKTDTGTVTILRLVGGPLDGDLYEWPNDGKYELHHGGQINVPVQRAVPFDSDGALYYWTWARDDSDMKATYEVRYMETGLAVAVWARKREV